MSRFDDALADFARGLEKITGGPVTLMHGRRYVRVVSGSAAYCFVDSLNGEVLKTNGWGGPRKTKRSRGNLYDSSGGLEQCMEHGLRSHGGLWTPRIIPSAPDSTSPNSNADVVAW